MEKSTIAFNNFIGIQKSPLDKSNLGFQKGESSLHERKNNKEEPKKPITNITSNKREIQGNKKQIKHLVSSQKNQQQKYKQNQQQIKQQNQKQRRKSQGAPTFRICFAPRAGRDRFVIFQRNQSPFVPFVHNVECYNYHKFGNISTNCLSRLYRPYQQRFQKFQQPRRMVNRYNYSFYGYCNSCHLFGHKEIDYRSNHQRRDTLLAWFRSGMSRRIINHLDHVKCCICHRFGHMARYCLLPIYSRKNRQRQQKPRGSSTKPVKKENTQMKEEKKHIKEERKHPKTLWKKKELQLFNQ